MSDLGQYNSCFICRNRILFQYILFSTLSDLFWYVAGLRKASHPRGGNRAWSRALHGETALFSSPCGLESGGADWNCAPRNLLLQIILDPLAHSRILVWCSHAYSRMLLGMHSLAVVPAPFLALLSSVLCEHLPQWNSFWSKVVDKLNKHKQWFSFPLLIVP